MSITQDVVAVARTCSFCGEKHFPTISKEDATRIKAKEVSLTEVLEDYSVETNIAITTGCHPECWDEMLKEKGDGFIPPGVNLPPF